MSRVLKLGTRGSQLALTQSRQVAQALEAAHEGLKVELEIIRTTGDRVTDVPLSRIGDKGLFTKELEQALLARTVDFAVHSMKDMPTRLPQGLVIGCVPTRKAPLDCLLSLRPGGFDALPEGARVASGSLRRRAQLLYARPDLRLEEMRGNVPTRIRRMAERGVDGTILAVAGLARLGVGGLEGALNGGGVEFEVPPSWDEEAAGTRVFIVPLPSRICLPAVGQGALCLETREGDGAVLDLLDALNDPDSFAEIVCERALMRALEGGCQVPIAAWARVEGERIRIEAIVASLDGRRLIRAELEGQAAEGDAIGREAAASLLAQGADQILEEIRQAVPEMPIGRPD
jgi:hydroxymethylbilane synthase